MLSFKPHLLPLQSHKLLTMTTNDHQGGMYSDLKLTPIIGGSCYKYHFCRDKSFVSTNRFVATKHVFCHDKSMLLLRQNYVCHDKIFLSQHSS